MREPKQERALATRSRIVGEAARHFALKGYHDTKLGEIFSGAEVTTGAFFHHFASKEDLGFAVINSHMDLAFGYGRAFRDEVYDCVPRRVTEEEKEMRWVN